MSLPKGNRNYWKAAYFFTLGAVVVLSRSPNASEYLEIHQKLALHDNFLPDRFHDSVPPFPFTDTNVNANVDPGKSDTLPLSDAPLPLSSHNPSDDKRGKLSESTEIAEDVYQFFPTVPPRNFSLSTPYSSMESEIQVSSLSHFYENSADIDSAFAKLEDSKLLAHQSGQTFPALYHEPSYLPIPLDDKTHVTGTSYPLSSVAKDLTSSLVGGMATMDLDDTHRPPIFKKVQHKELLSKPNFREGDSLNSVSSHHLDEPIHSINFMVDARLSSNSDLNSFSVASSVDSCRNPHSVATNDRFTYVACHNTNNRLFRFDAMGKYEVFDTPEFCNNPIAVAVSRTASKLNSFVYLVCWQTADTLFRFDEETKKFDAFHVNQGCNFYDVAADGLEVYLACHYNRKLLRITWSNSDAESFTLESLLVPPQCSRPVGVSSYDGLAYLVCWGDYDKFYEFRAGSNAGNVINLPTGGCSHPRSIAVDANHVYVVCYYNYNGIYRLSIPKSDGFGIESTAIALSVVGDACFNPHHVAISENGTVLVVCDNSPGIALKFHPGDISSVTLKTAGSCVRPVAVSYGYEPFMACLDTDNKIFPLYDICAQISGSVKSILGDSCICRKDYFSEMGVGPCQRCPVGTSASGLGNTNCTVLAALDGTSGTFLTPIPCNGFVIALTSNDRYVYMICRDTPDSLFQFDGFMFRVFNIPNSRGSAVLAANGSYIYLTRSEIASTLFRFNEVTEKTDTFFTRDPCDGPSGVSVNSDDVYMICWNTPSKLFIFAFNQPSDVAIVMGKPLLTSTECRNPRGIAASNFFVLMVCQSSNDVLYKFEYQSGQPNSVGKPFYLRSCLQPIDVVIKGDVAYVLCYANHFMFQIDLSSGYSISMIEPFILTNTHSKPCYNPHKASVSDNGGLSIVCLSSPNTVFQFSGLNFHVRTLLSTPSECLNPADISTTGDGNGNLYISCRRNNVLIRVHDTCSHLAGTIQSPTTGECLCRVDHYSVNGRGPCERCPEGSFTASSIGSTDCRSIFIGGPSSGISVPNESPCTFPQGVANSRYYSYMICQDSYDRLFRYDGTEFKVFQTPTCAFPFAVATLEDNSLGSYVYIACHRTASTFLRFDEVSETFDILTTPDTCDGPVDVDVDGTDVYMACYYTPNKIFKFSWDRRPAGGGQENVTMSSLATSTQCSHPRSLTALRGSVFLVCESQNDLLFHFSTLLAKPTSHGVSMTIPSCAQPIDVIANEDFVYVLCHASHVIYRIPIVDGAPAIGNAGMKMTLDFFPTICRNPYKASLSRGGDVYVTCWNTPDAIFRLSHGEMAVTKLATAGSCNSPRDVAVYHNGTSASDVFVACYYNNNKLHRVHDTCSHLAGTIQSPTTGECLCRVNHYSVHGRGPCERCPEGSTTTNSEGNSTCTLLNDFTRSSKKIPFLSGSTPCYNPVGVASSLHFTYVVCHWTASRLYQYDGTFFKSYLTPNCPHPTSVAVAKTANDSFVYIACLWADSTLIRFDQKTELFSLFYTTERCAGYSDVAVDFSNVYLVCSDDSKLFKFSFANMIGAAPKGISVGSNLLGCNRPISVTASNGLAAISCEYSRNVIQVSDEGVGKIIVSNCDCNDFSCSAMSESYLYVVCRNGPIYSIDKSALSVPKPLLAKNCRNPADVDIDWSGNAFFSCHSSSFFYKHYIGEDYLTELSAPTWCSNPGSMSSSGTGGDYMLFTCYDSHDEIFLVADDCSEVYGGAKFGDDCWCRPDYYSDSGRPNCGVSCTCDANFFSDNLDGQQPCSLCPTESYSAAGSNTCSCNGGFVGINGNIPCSECPSNSDSYHWTHVDGRNWAVQGFPAKTDCFCDPGYFGVSGKPPCEKCPVGSDTARGIYTTILRTQNYPGDCFYWCGYVPTIISESAPAQSTCICLIGYFSSSGNGPCSKCLHGTSNLASRSIGSDVYSGCPVCDVGFFGVRGAPPCEKCPAGSSNKVKGESSCIYCDYGYYSPSGMAPCAACPVEATTTDIGRSECVLKSTLSPPSQAPTAYGLIALTPSPTISAKPSVTPSRSPVKTRRPTIIPSNAPTAPLDCDIGYFSLSGKEPCTPCGVGATTQYGGSSFCTCISGFFGKDGQTPCYKCRDGHISDPGASACISCEGFAPCMSNFSVSSYLTLNSPSLLTLAPSTSATIGICGLGFFSPDGSSPCSKCPEGETTVSSGATNCQLANTASDKCPVGHFSSTGTYPCTECPVGSNATNVGSESCMCQIGYFGIGGYKPCLRCLRGYSSHLGAEDCFQLPQCMGFSCTDSFDAEVYAQMLAWDGLPTFSPTSSAPSNPTMKPTVPPSIIPSALPSVYPSVSPTLIPTDVPSIIPTEDPTCYPTDDPTVSFVPSRRPTRQPTSLLPSLLPSHQPIPTNSPVTRSPTRNPTRHPTKSPLRGPTRGPTRSPTGNPTKSPSRSPTRFPSRPSAVPS